MQTKKRPLKIKVCGLTQPANVEEVSALRPDFTGFIFYPGSSRFVGEHPDPALFRIPGEGSAKVGVFVNETVSRVKKVFESFLLDLVQLHGSESFEYCRELIGSGIPVIKAVHEGADEKENQNPEGDSGHVFEAETLNSWCGAAHYLLFDSGKSGSGGSGKQFDWSRLDNMDIPLPFLLGGGIGPDDAGRIRQLTHPSLYGVDLNSRFEIAPGIKDTELLRSFIGEIRETTIGNETETE